ncbi:RNA polymerase sigma factor [Spirosoma rhododendri]|uniref:RNA polymerase sigma factor n=1 Tax=Spirosoma rhododendri TaxID=2728024 RepID=A0A7L5DPC0_9BACT|nr:RNA polymerase sigma factor [Spirosoma rhododendri]QJD79321.1 RNA polymerase sigma factor [Spirosoma rhododendri]
MTVPVEDELWQRFRSGDEQAFTAIYNAHFTTLYRYGYHIANDDELVKDTIQTLFIDLWRGRRNLSPTDSIKFYLLKAMRRQVYRAIRQQSAAFTDADAAHGLSFSPEFDFITLEVQAQQQAQLRQAIDQLSHRQREAITLLYIDGLAYPEIADMMAVQVRTVYNLVYEALEKLRKLLVQPGFWVMLMAGVVI